LKSVYPAAAVGGEKTPSGVPLFASVAVSADQIHAGLIVERGEGGSGASAVEALAAEASGARPGSGRWTGALRTPAARRYRFEISSANATSVFFNGEETISVSPGGRISKDVWLPQGIVPLRIQRDVRRPDSLEVLWEPPGETGLVALPRDATAAGRVP